MHTLCESPAACNPFADARRALAQRVADAHKALGDSSLLALVSGSVVEDLADARSDVDMSVVLRELPDAGVLVS